MSIADSESSTTSSRTRARARDTGFPEGFCGNRNTSLPHPDADLSPNASISSDDIAVSRAISRHRRSFLAGKNRRTISHGLITAEMEQMYSDVAVTSDSDASPVIPQSAQLPTISDQRPVSGGADSFRSTSTSGGDHEDAAPRSPRQPRFSVDSTASPGRRRRRSLLEKLGIRRHHE
ncbi:unnamed protein product [Discula destructiva]